MEESQAMIRFAGLDVAVEAHRHQNPDGSKGGWVADTANVADTAYVEPEATVYGQAKVDGTARISDNAAVFGSARIGGAAVIEDNAKVFDFALVKGHARVGGDAKIYGSAHVEGSVVIDELAKIRDYARILDDARVSGTAVVGARVIINGKTRLIADTWKCNPLVIYGTVLPVTMASKREMRIGCMSHTFAYWRQHGRQMGQSRAWTPEQIIEYSRYLDLAEAMYGGGAAESPSEPPADLEKAAECYKRAREKQCKPEQKPELSTATYDDTEGEFWTCAAGDHVVLPFGKVPIKGIQLMGKLGENEFDVMLVDEHDDVVMALHAVFMKKQKQASGATRWIQDYIKNPPE